MDEYAALTAQPEEEENPVEELEWNNVPPAPEKLPDDYKDDSFDEEDPALEFPPKEEDFTESESDNSEDEEIPEDEIVEEETPQFSEESEVEEDSDDNFEEENPYATARFIDTAVEHPKYPSGIVIADEDDSEESEEVDEKSFEVESPKYPSKISLGDEVDVDIEDFEKDDLNTEISDFEESLNETSFDEIEEPAINQNNEEKDPFEGMSNLDFDNFESDNEKSDEIVFEEEPEIEENQAEEKIPEVKAQPVEEKKSFFEKINEEEKPAFTSSISSVFSDMEADIRKHQPIPEVVEDDQDIIENPVNVNFNGEIEEEVNEYSEVNPVGKTATILTKDELTDFFNAQQEENTPKTREILPNPPKNGNMAMKKGPYLIPSDLLIAYKDDKYWIIDETTKQASLNLKQTLAEFNIEADIIGIKKGPVVTMFEILPAPGVKLSKIVSLQDNIALALAAQSVRIVAPIPGKQAVGIEVPNKHRSIVGFREIIEMDLPEWQKMAVPVILGKDILGKAQLIDLVKTPHMLIAGATGSGKSVCVNSLILSILYKRSPRDVKMILVDPKVVELKLYNDIPHLLTPVITEPKKALQSLQWCLCEMERRYALLDGMGVRDISNYNIKIKEQNIATEKLPYIVVIIDEFADLMATSGKEMESVVARLTAMSRAVGIHLVLATQRPSVNVITGLIKANIPTRIAFMVASRTDSNIIIDSVGAEKLLGRGDMLYASAVDPAPIRIQGTFVSDQEVEDVVGAVKEYGEPDYIDDEIFTDDDDDNGARDLFGEPMDDEDPLYDQALEIVVQAGKASASYLQRRLKIGYNRAARLVEEMEERGIVGAANGSKAREVIHIP
ncbi:MAG: DNA translocase FtsK [Treponema sp.]|nr:DNA translocase FtsK [Treponema sp.]